MSSRSSGLVPSSANGRMIQQTARMIPKSTTTAYTIPNVDTFASLVLSCNAGAQRRRDRRREVAFLFPSTGGGGIGVFRAAADFAAAPASKFAFAPVADLLRAGS